MTHEIQLFLVPTPGAKPEFLATMEPAGESSDSSEAREDWTQGRLPSKLVLEAYTRDSWAWKPAGPSVGWKSIQAVSVDGRNKLPGFVKYLKERQKSAFGRYLAKDPSMTTGVFVVTYIQKDKEGGELTCKFASDIAQIPGCNLKPMKPPPQSTTARDQRQPAQRQEQHPPSAPSSSTSRKGGAGMLGNLLGKQQKTNNLIKQPVKGNKVASSTSNGDSSSAGEPQSADGGGGGGAAPAAADGAPTRTLQEVFVEFRRSMEEKMLDFDIASDTSMRVKLVMGDITEGLPEEAKASVTMEALQFMVIEQAEEVNEEWIAHAEPSEFLDEVEMVVYKEGEAPEEVLEEVNRVELTEEMRGQQRANQEAHRKKMAQQERLQDKKNEQKRNNVDDEDLAALNQQKRDRRTIEEIQRDMVGGGDNDNMTEGDPGSKRMRVT